VVDRYRLQVEAYAGAMQRIYEMPVKQQLLYFFRLNKFIEL
jgi:ATP-dependent exoDNAse (exonuclease V) beta subunit